jgi:hypothetical protein
VLLSDAVARMDIFRPTRGDLRAKVSTCGSG